MKDERNVFERRPHDGPSYKQSELPPFANCAKDGAPTVFLASARAKAWATRPRPKSWSRRVTESYGGDASAFSPASPLNRVFRS
jgi:hypothetical protein